MNWKYLFNRLVFVLVVIWSGITVNFFLPRLTGQDPIRERINKQIAAGALAGVGEQLDALILHYDRQFGLDKPLWQQYFSYMGNLLRLEFGQSIFNYPTKVSTIIFAALPWTIGLLGVTTFLSVLIGSLFGALLAWNRSVIWLQFVAAPLIALSAIPYYLLGLILLFTFSYGVKLLPGSGGFSFTSIPNWSWKFAFDVLLHMILPSFSVILSAAGFWALGMRGNMVSVEGEDFMTMAEAKGLKGSTLFFNYAVRNTLLPQTTALALALGYVLSGSILVEVVFGLPGIGTVLFDAVKGVDFPVIQGVIFTVILALAMSTLVLDLTLPLIDPRIKYDKL